MQIILLALLIAISAAANAQESKRYELTARASEIDPRAMPHPEIDFIFEKAGKPLDIQHGWVDGRVKSRHRLVIWLMDFDRPLFERVSSYGYHAISVHYANRWFPKFGKEPPPADKQFLGKIRIEAATGEDHSDSVAIPKPDGMMERAVQFVRWLAKENPHGQWEQFLTPDRNQLRWDLVIISGASHGASTAARFAKQVRVDRVVMLCGPRDQYENWQSLPSATPASRYFGFSHVLDGGWIADHYCRSWELLGLRDFGPIMDVDKTPAPFGNSRRLVTSADLGGKNDRAHTSVIPGGSVVKDEAGKPIHEAVWHYLFTHPVEKTGASVPHEQECQLEQSQQR